MKVPRLVPLALCVLISSCASLSPQERISLVDTYLAQERYGDALDTLDSARDDDPRALKDKRAAVLKQAKAYEQATIARVNELMRQNDWQAARATLEKARTRFRQSEPLLTTEHSLNTRQSERVRELRNEQIIAHGQWLAAALSAQETIVRTDPASTRDQRTFNKLRSDASAVAAELIEIGTDALDRGNHQLATRALPLAERISPSSAGKKAMARLKKSEAIVAEQQEKVQKQETRRLLAEYRQLMDKDDYRQARQIITKLMEADGENPEVKEEHALFTTRINTVVRKHMDQGVTLYGRGRFEAAIEQWKKVLAIQPDNQQARAHLDRATRVLDKLNQLREKQAPAQSAPR